MMHQQEQQRGFLAHSDEQFPVKLYAMLELAEVRGFGCSGCSWLAHGRAFRVDDETEFMEVAVPMFFKLTKIRSFYRQLNLWGFKRVSKGIDAGAWYNKHFLRGSPDDIKHITRTKVKGVKSGDYPESTRPTDGPGKDPDFYSMPPLPGLFRPTNKAAMNVAGFPLPLEGVLLQGRATTRPRRVSMESVAPALPAAGSGDPVLFKYVPRSASIVVSGKNNPQSSMRPSYGQLVHNTTAATEGCPSRRISMDLVCPPALQGEAKVEQPRRVSAPTMGTTGSDMASLMQMHNEMMNGVGPPSLRAAASAEQPRRVSCPTIGKTGGLSTSAMASLMQRCEGAVMMNSIWIQHGLKAKEVAMAVPVSASPPTSSFSRKDFGAEDVKAAMGWGLKPPPFLRDRDIMAQTQRQQSGLKMHNNETTQGAPPANKWLPLRQTSINPVAALEVTTAADPSYDSMVNFIFQKYNLGAGQTPKAEPAHVLPPLHAFAPASADGVKGLIAAGLEPLPFVAQIDNPPPNGGRKRTGTKPAQCEAGTSGDEFANYIANVIQTV